MSTDSPEDFDPIDLASAISSRICHDLVSPVGAIVNGIDLVREIGAAGVEDEISMIGQSAERASGLLQFYRLSFGAAPDDAEGLARSILQEHARTMINWQRISLDWPMNEGPPLSRAEAKLLCLLLLSARSVTGMAGVIRVVLDPHRGLPLHVTILGNGAPDADERLALLTGDAQMIEPSARLVEFVLARGTAATLGAELAVERRAGTISISALPG